VLAVLGGSLRLARLTAVVRLRVLYNAGWRKAGAGRRVANAVLVVAAGLLLLLFAWTPEVVTAWFGTGGIDDATLAAGVRASLGVGLFVYLVLLLYGSFTFTLASMLLNRDLELLLVAPWPAGAILGARIWTRTVWLLLLALLLFGPLIVALSLARGQPGAILVALAVLALLPALVAVVVGVLALAVVRFVPPTRGREVLTVLGLGLAGGINLANVLLNPAYGLGGRHHGGFDLETLARSPLFSSPLLPSTWGARAVADAVAGYWGPALGWTGLLLAAGALATALGTTAMGALYLSGWSQSALGGGRPRRRRVAERAGDRALPAGVGGVLRGDAPEAGHGVLPAGVGAVRGGAPDATAPAMTGRGRRLHPAALALVRKDWRVRRRDLVLFVRALLPLFFLALLFLRNAGNAVEAVRSLGPGPMAALAAVSPALLVLVAISSELGLSAIGLEGGAIWIWAVSPNSMRRLLAGKCLAAAVPTMALATLLGSALEAIAAPGWGWALGAIALLALTAGCLSVSLVCLGGLSPRFDWTDARRIVPPAISWLALLLEVILFGAVAALAALPLAVAAALREPQLGAFLLGLALGGAAALAIAAASFPIAAARLSRLEPGRGLLEQPA
jgi:hypothetical protein